MKMNGLKRAIVFPGQSIVVVRSTVRERRRGSTVVAGTGGPVRRRGPDEKDGWTAKSALSTRSFVYVVRGHTGLPVHRSTDLLNDPFPL